MIITNSKQLRESIQRIRWEKNLYLYQVSEGNGFSSVLLNQFENGKRLILVDKLLLILGALGYGIQLVELPKKD